VILLYFLLHNLASKWGREFRRCLGEDTLSCKANESVPGTERVFFCERARLAPMYDSIVMPGLGDLHGSEFFVKKIIFREIESCFIQ
jgi:hypothetical protein